MEQEQAINILETILFVSDAPVPAEKICDVIDGYKKQDVGALVEALNARYDGRGLNVVEIAEGFQLRTRGDYVKWIKKFHKLNRSTRLSPASLETLSIISYKQPITRQEVDDIRGVDCSGVLKTLLDKNLIKSMGRKKVPGRPMTFGTTRKFLEYFGLVKLSDLPTLKDFSGEEAEAEQESIDFGPGSEGEEKQPSDIQIEEEKAATEPAEEDYGEDEIDEEEDNEEEADEDDEEDDEEEDIKEDDTEDDDEDDDEDDEEEDIKEDDTEDDDDDDEEEDTEEDDTEEDDEDIEEDPPAENTG